MLTMNLIPLLELDGYFILSDYLRVPELRAMSFSFTAHELLPRLRERERLTRREWALVLYAVLGVLFTIFSFWTAYFYWRTVFAETIRNLWDAGAPGRITLAVGGVVVAGPLVRGLIDLLRSIARRLRALRRRLLFRLERGWRVEAGELLAGVPMFSELDEDALGDLAGRVRLRTYARGEAAVRQGERAVAFFLVRSGTFQVVEEDRERGTERVLRVLGRGETFGELGLVEAAPRSATVRALEEAEAFEIGKSTFDRILAEMVEVPGFAPTVQGAAELRELSCFSHLEPDELGDLLSLGSWVNVPPGETVITQGEPGDAFYAVRSGRVEVEKDGTTVATLGTGEWFGEVALLLDTARTATVRAVTPVRTFRLSRQGFDRLVARSFRRGTLTPHAAADRLWHH
jgi:CRP-like cAMP-binding protein